MAITEKLKRLFPYASQAFLEANPDPGLQDSESERLQGSSLGKTSQGTQKSFQRTRVCITAFTVRPRDQDNLAGGCKALIDVMKNVNLILDDDPYSMELTVKQRHVDHFNQEKTLLTIEYF